MTTTSLVCSGGETLCDAACADLSSDPLHCGYCAHDCLGAACNDGLCDPTELVTGLLHPDSLAVDQTHLFFTTQDGTIQRVPKIGGAPDVLAKGLSGPASITLHAGYVYWSDRINKTIQRIARNGLGQVQTLCSPQAYMDRIAVNDSGVYFTIPFDMMGNNIGWLGQLPLSGGEPTWVLKGLTYPHFLTVTDDKLYFGQAVVDGTGFVGGYVSEAPLAGGVVKNLATDEVTPQGIAVDAEAVYWANDTDQNIRKATLATGEVTTLASGQDVAFVVALDETHVYWTTLNAGTVSRVPKMGGPVEILASGRERPFALAVDGKRVYWTESMDVGRVLSVPK